MNPHMLLVDRFETTLVSGDPAIGLEWLIVHEAVSGTQLQLWTESGTGVINFTAIFRTADEDYYLDVIEQAPHRFVRVPHT